MDPTKQKNKMYRVQERILIVYDSGWKLEPRVKDRKLRGVRAFIQ